MDIQNNIDNMRCRCGAPFEYRGKIGSEYDKRGKLSVYYRELVCTNRRRFIRHRKYEVSFNENDEPQRVTILTSGQGFGN